MMLAWIILLVLTLIHSRGFTFQEGRLYMLGVDSLHNENPVLLFAASSSLNHPFKMLETFRSCLSSSYSPRASGVAHV